MNLNYTAGSFNSIKIFGMIVTDFITKDQDELLKAVVEYTKMLATGVKKRTIKIKANSSLDQAVKIKIIGNKTELHID